MYRDPGVVAGWHITRWMSGQLCAVFDPNGKRDFLAVVKLRKDCTCVGCNAPLVAGDHAWKPALNGGRRYERICLTCLVPDTHVEPPSSEVPLV